MVEQGLSESRTKAQALIMSGIVLVDDKRVEKASEKFAANVAIRLKGNSEATKYVGRGGLKLEKALAEYGIWVDEYVCLDVGASTGGFTDCLLQHGARKVYAIDVGTNQLAWKLRNDKRVVVLEKVNARSINKDDFDDEFDLIVMDVSFISVKKILPVLPPLLCERGTIVVLIKPQFEVGRTEVGKGGIVTDPAKHERVIQEINEFAAGIGLGSKGIIDSPITGAHGNKEFLVRYEPVG